MFISSSGIFFGPIRIINSAFVSSSIYFYVDHSVIFLFPAKLDTISQPIKAWNIGRAYDITGPMLPAIWRAAR